NQWTPNGQTGGVVPAGGYLPNPPPGYTPVNQPAGGRPRLTQPAVAGPDGVRPAGGVVLPPPSMDIPPFRPGPGAVPPPPGAPNPNTPPARPLPPPNLSLDPPAGESKFGPAPAPLPESQPVVPPTAPGNPGAPPVPPAAAAP